MEEVSESCETSKERVIQESRSFLRERFLRALFAVSNKPCTFSMYERTKVEATFRSTDIETTSFQVSNLVTPMGVLPEALVRASDVLTITVDTNCGEQFESVYWGLEEEVRQYRLAFDTAIKCANKIIFIKCAQDFQFENSMIMVKWMPIQASRHPIACRHINF